jgi:hypothetical protein
VGPSAVRGDLKKGNVVGSAGILSLIVHSVAKSLLLLTEEQ